MSCSRVRRELLEQFRFPEELGPRSGPHLAHLESCAECRREVGVDLQLIEQLRRALQERVEGSAPPAAAWELVRRRTVDRTPRPWTVRVLRWGGMLPAAVAGVMMFAIATTSDSALVHGEQSPATAALLAESWSNKVDAVIERPAPPRYGSQAQASGRDAHEMPPIPGRMR